MAVVNAVLHATLPPRWRPFSAPELVIVARPPVDRHRFSATLLIARDEVPAGVTMRDVLDATAPHLETLGDDTEVLGERCVREDAHERVGRLVSFAVRGVCDRVAQLQCFVAPVRCDGERRPVAQFVGTCAFDELGLLGPVFARVARSIHFV
ncbi:MAG TPA: hypothetical protein VF183_05435 [Acidimicrobiales bacterium]